MTSKDDRFGLKKSIVFSVIIVLMFFMSLEAFQRIRYTLKFRSAYWMLYGFVKRPEDYQQMLETGILKGRNVKSVELLTLKYGKGGESYRKYNPKRNEGNFINSYGFRCGEFSLQKDPGVRRIVAMGGSTTFGLGVKDAYTYPAYMDRMLNPGGGKKCEVINAGVSGSDIKEIRNLFKSEILKLKPDVLILDSVVNNLNFSNAAFRSRRISLHEINQFLLAKSLFYMTLREKVAIKLNKNLFNLYMASSQDMRDNFMKDNSFWDALEKDYREIALLAAANGMKVYFVEEPVRLSEYNGSSGFVLLDKKMEPVYDRAMGLLKKVAAENGAHVVEAFKYFNEPAQAGLFLDGVHLTEKGNERLAEMITDAMGKGRRV